MIDNAKKRYERTIHKMAEYERIADDEKQPQWKRNQAMSKLKEMERKHFPKVFHKGGTYIKPEEEEKCDTE